MSETYRTADQVRAKAARYLSDAVEVGTEFLYGDLVNLLFNTDAHVTEAAAMAAVDGEGDGFPAELEVLVEQHKDDENHDLLAFKVAMALYTR